MHSPSKVECHAGFEFQLLGRGEKVSEFIKRGEDSAEVEITLCTDDAQRPLVVHRKIRKDNSSDWKLNGTTSFQLTPLNLLVRRRKEGVSTTP
eukprot:8382742-Pyramimonas_sp.AAC.1